jgi:uncharacterized membrane protein YidH (DUF202 family)
MNWIIFGIVATLCIVSIGIGIGGMVHYQRHPANPEDVEKGNTLPQKVLSRTFKIIAFYTLAVIALIVIFGIILIVWVIIKNIH